MKQKKAQRLGVQNRNFVAKHQFQKGGAHKDKKLDYTRKEKHKGRKFNDFLSHIVAEAKLAVYYYFHPIKHFKNIKKK